MLNPLFWPRWAQYLAIAAAALLLLFGYVKHRENAAVRADRAEAAAKANATARRADEAALGKSEAVRTEMEKTNADARKAAADSPDDPLRAGLDQLRSRQAADRPPARDAR